MSGERRQNGFYRMMLVAVAAAGLSMWRTPAARGADTPAGVAHATAIPDEFFDPETHLRVVHLSRFPNNYSGVIYFNYPSFTQDSRLALIDQQYADKWRYLFSFDFETMAVKPLVVDKLTQNQVVASKSGNLYYQADNAVWVIDIHGGTPRKIADLPAKWSPGAGFSVNADETYLLGASPDVDGPPPAPPTEQPMNAAARPAMGVVLAAHQPNVLFTVNIKTSEVKVIHRENNWLDHIQFSPTDPDLLLYAHEGNWEMVDRMWTMRLSNPVPELVYKRTEPHEIVGHEFWGPDGKTIWFQQTFRDLKKGYLTGKDLASGKLTQYAIPTNATSIHYTISPDGTFFVGDGIGKTPTAPTKYLSLLMPEGGQLKVTHLVSLQKNDYAVEPNPHISPDNRWIIFTATLFGTAQAYGVEVPPAMLEGRKTQRVLWDGRDYGPHSPPFSPAPYGVPVVGTP